MTARSAWTACAPAGILAIGAVLRLHNLQMMEFKGDEQEALNLGMRLLDAHPWSSAAPWPTHGILSSAGVGNSPLFTWIVAAALAPGIRDSGRADCALQRGMSLSPLAVVATTDG